MTETELYRAVIEEALAALAALEWSGRHKGVTGLLGSLLGGRCCPSCRHAGPEGHTRACRLATAIRACREAM